jgi:hypothetical protein
MSIELLLILGALVCFVLAACGQSVRHIVLVPLGLALLTITLLV